jgi:murein DD-endopeptidase MepM/ murein hydrolase activator NlpD
MPARRYTIVVADRTTGVVRRITISARPVIAAVCAVASLPVLIGVGAAWKARADVAALYVSHQQLEVENASYRSATESLAGEIDSLQTAIKDIGARATLDPNLAKAMDRLPALVKARAMGGGTVTERAVGGSDNYTDTLSALATPEDTFGLLRTLLGGIESRLVDVKKSVDRRNALATATPSLWPIKGWITSRMGYREDPIKGGPDFHPGLDIAGDRGEAVHVTAAGVVKQVGYDAGGYGNLIVVDHGFGLQTKYGHLLSFNVKAGQKVERGDTIGRVGSTGRSTGYHLHYEVLANGRLLNPLQLLTQQKPRAQ